MTLDYCCTHGFPLQYIYMYIQKPNKKKNTKK